MTCDCDRDSWFQTCCARPGLFTHFDVQEGRHSDSLYLVYVDFYVADPSIPQSEVQKKL
jgi:hypothetical protein